MAAGSTLPPPLLGRLDRGAVWREVHPRHLVNNALSLCGQLLTRADLQRMSEVDRELQHRLLPVLVDGVRIRGMERRSYTRLHHAAIKDWAVRARALLAAGADVGSTDTPHRSALVVSSVESARGAVGVLLARDEAIYPLPKLEKEAHNGALYYAAAGGRLELLAALLERGVNPNTQGSFRATALHGAALTGRTPVMQLLLDAGAEVDAITGRGETPLILAANAGRLEAVRLLLDAGADVNVRTPDGRTALWLARQRDHEEIETLLRARGASASL